MCHSMGALECLCTVARCMRRVITVYRRDVLDDMRG